LTATLQRHDRIRESIMNLLHVGLETAWMEWSFKADFGPRFMGFFVTWKIITGYG
jgi:hypothetical protein